MFMLAYGDLLQLYHTLVLDTFLSIIDDYSRMLWIYPQNMKDYAIENFKSWKCLMENQVSNKIKRFRTNNGLEFCSELFKTFWKEKDIARNHQMVAKTHY